MQKYFKWEIEIKHMRGFWSYIFIAMYCWVFLDCYCLVKDQQGEMAKGFFLSKNTNHSNWVLYIFPFQKSGFDTGNSKSEFFDPRWYASGYASEMLSARSSQLFIHSSEQIVEQKGQILNAWCSQKCIAQTPSPNSHAAHPAPLISNINQNHRIWRC